MRLTAYDKGSWLTSELGLLQQYNPFFQTMLWDEILWTIGGNPIKMIGPANGWLRSARLRKFIINRSTDRDRT